MPILLQLDLMSLRNRSFSHVTPLPLNGWTIYAGSMAQNLCRNLARDGS